ncbi:SH3 domain-containing protein [Picosynechococcus sp. PCC 73109]|uniref:SH3 domain-containing protein n=1 Tax=Picosynechococcus sp. PCC 73109 TaxID=374982 RepID=UPI000ABB9E54|nr:SH3 domain-containing protein [Picosynechococcus sp. PCC 73109]
MKKFLFLLTLSSLLPVLTPQAAWANSRASIPSNICDNHFRRIQSSDNIRLRLYSTPSYDNNGYPSHNASTIIRVLKNGTEVMINMGDSTGRWTEITIPGGTTGWVLTNALAASSIGSSSFNGYMRVHTLDGGIVNLRSEPWLTSQVVKPLQTGELVRYRNFDGYWHEVSTTDGRRGFVASQYLVCD